MDPVCLCLCRSLPSSFLPFCSFISSWSYIFVLGTVCVFVCLCMCVSGVGGCGCIVRHITAPDVQFALQPRLNGGTDRKRENEDVGVMASKKMKRGTNLWFSTSSE